jgi:hypothetical protein
LKDHVQVSVEEMRTGLDHALEGHRKMKDDFERDRRERLQVQEELHEKVDGFLVKERAERELHHSTLSTLIQGATAGYSEELAQHRNSLQVIEARTYKAQKDHMAALDSRLADPLSRLQDIERRFAHVQASIQQECESRSSLHEVFDQMLQSERTKLTNLITQKANIARLDLAGLEKTWQEKLDKEISERVAAEEGQKSELGRTQVAVKERMDRLQNEWHELENRSSIAHADAKGVEHMYRKLESEVNAIRAASADQHRQTQQAFADERAAREAGAQQIEDQLDWLGDVHDRMRNIFSFKQQVKPSVPSVAAIRAASPAAAASTGGGAHQPIRGGPPTRSTAAVAPEVPPWQQRLSSPPATSSYESAATRNGLPYEPLARLTEPLANSTGSEAVRSPLLTRDYSSF